MVSEVIFTEALSCVQVRGGRRGAAGISRPGEELGQAGRTVGGSGAARLRALLLAHF